MGSSKETKVRLPRGVSALSTSRGGRSFRASFRRGKGEVIHLGLYKTPWLAGFAYEAALRALGRGDGSMLEIPLPNQPTADEVRAINANVRRRLGLEKSEPFSRQHPPSSSDLVSLFEITVVGFWRNQAADDSWGHPGAGLDAAAHQLAAAAQMLFWSREREHPSPYEVMKKLLGRRVDAVFQLQKLTREMLDDDGDDLERLARWLVYPDKFVTSRGRSFVDEIRVLYSDIFADEAEESATSNSGTLPDWATVLGVLPPFRLDRIREAYRARSRVAHPDVGGTAEEFVRLNTAYEAARAYCESRGR